MERKVRRSIVSEEYLLNVIVRKQAFGLLLVFGESFLLSPPPAVVAHFEDEDQVAIADLKFPFGLRAVIVNGPVNAYKAHDGGIAAYGVATRVGRRLGREAR